MTRNIKTAAKLITFIGAFALTGCAFVPVTVHPTYTPPANVQKVPSADKVAVQVIVKNEKKRHNEVSVTKDGYGIPMAGVYMHIRQEFSSAMESALKTRGFLIQNNGEKVTVIVTHFFLPEQMHLWSASHTGSGSMLLTVSNKTGEIIFKKVFTVKNIYFDKRSDFSNMNLTSAGRKQSAQILLEKMVNKAANDKSFIDALIHSEQESALSNLKQKMRRLS